MLHGVYVGMTVPFTSHLLFKIGLRNGRISFEIAVRLFCVPCIACYLERSLLCLLYSKEVFSIRKTFSKAPLWCVNCLINVTSVVMIPSMRSAQGRVSLPSFLRDVAVRW